MTETVARGSPHLPGVSKRKRSFRPFLDPNERKRAAWSAFDMDALIDLVLFKNKGCKSSDTWEGHASSGSGVHTWIFNFADGLYPERFTYSKSHRREEYLFPTLGAFYIGCTMRPLAQYLQFILAVRAKTRHRGMVGILFFQFLLFCLDTGIAQRVKRFWIDFCSPVWYTLC